MKIIHTEASCGWGGQEVRILTESQGLIRRGHQVESLCPEEAVIFRKAQELSIPVTPLPLRRRNWKGLAAVRHWLRWNRADVINTHSSSDSWLVAVAARSLLKRPRIVRTRHLGAPVPNNPASNWVYGHGADFVVTCGQSVRQQLIERNKVAAERCQSVPTGIDVLRFTPGDRRAVREQLNLPVEKPILGIVAALRREKGHETLCQAAAVLAAQHDFDLLIVGDGLSRDLVREWVERHGLSGRTHLVGNQQNVVPWLQAMDLFVLPSWGIEGVPQSIMQAMSCQLAVVATDVGSISEAVQHEQTGLLVPPEQPEQLAAALARLLENRTQREQFAKAGLELARSRFTIENMLDDMEQIFQNICAGRQRLAA